MILPYQIKELINDHFEINIVKKTRKRIYTEPRFMYFFLCREHTSYTLEKIAKEIDYDHSSVVHGIKMTKILIVHERKFRENFTAIEEKVFKLKNRKIQPVIIKKPKVVHPFRFRDAKQLRKVFKQRGQFSEGSYEIFSSAIPSSVRYSSSKRG